MKPSQIKKVVKDIFNETDKDFVVISYIEERIGQKVGIDDLCSICGCKWKTMTTSARGFLPQYQKKYAEKAKKDIPQIYFGPKGFENYQVGGGCAYVVIRP
jgi:hypothetical protein